VSNQMRDTVGRVGAAAGLLVAPFYLALIIVLGSLEPGFSHRMTPMSVLGGVPGPRGLVFNLGVAATGVMVIGFANSLRRRLPPRAVAIIGVGILVIGGLGLIGAGYFHCNEGCTNVLADPDLVGRLHIVMSLLAGMGTGLAPFFVWGAIRREDEWRDFATQTLAAGVLANVPGVVFWSTVFTGLELDPIEGLIQRMGLIVVLIWIFFASARLRRPGPAL